MMRPRCRICEELGELELLEEPDDFDEEVDKELAVSLVFEIAYLMLRRLWIRNL